MQRSDLTLTDYKTRAEDLLDLDSNSDLNDLTVVIAVNDFLASYVPEEQKAFPSLSRQTVTITVPAGGYDLSTIDDFGFIDKVYLTNKQTGYRMFPISAANPHFGYSFDGTTITLSDNAEHVCIIDYFKKPTKYSLSTLPDFDETVPPVLQGVEEGIELMIASRYTRKDQSDPQAAVNYKNDSLAVIANFFNTNKKSAFISLHI